MSRRRALVLLSVLLVGLLLILITRPWRSSRDDADPPTHQRERVDPFATTETGERPQLGSAARLMGKVLDTQDVPIANAQVCMSPGNRSRMAEQRWRPRCVVADEAGWFEIDGVAPGTHRLIASARGFIPLPVARGRIGLLTTIAAGQAREDLVIRLCRGGGEVRGVVYDITGGTVSGALVSSETMVTRTDDDGRFSLWLDVRSYVELSVRAEGYADTSVLEWRPIGRELEIRLRPEVVLVGRVVRADSGEPVPGVAVILHAPRMLGFGPSAATQPHVWTDADGRFRFTGLGPGRYKPEVRSGNWRGVARESVLLTLGVQPEEVLIRAHPARQLGGRVVEAGSGEPCEAGMITIHDAFGAAVDSGIADSSGAILVGGLLPGPYTVEAKCEQSLPSVHEVVDLSEDDVLDAVWTIEMPSGRAIRGRVVDASGKGVAMAFVQGELREPEDPGSHAVARAVTADDGSFEMVDLPPGLYSFYRIQAEGLGEPSEEPKVTLLRDRDVDDFEIVLPVPGALRVRVRDPSGEPVPDTEIDVGKGLGGSIWKSTPQSEWLLDPLTPGSYHVRALRPGVHGRAGPDDPSHGQLGEPVEVIAGQTAELTLTVPARKETIAGIVRTTDGEPIADAEVWALASETYIDWGGREKHPEVARTVTDIDGRFTLDHLEAGTHAVHVRSQAGVEQVRDEVASGTKQLVFELPRGGSVAGRVAVRGGEPPSSFSISVKLVDGRRGRTETFLFTEGEWRIVGLPPGEATVEVSAAEGTASAPVTIPEGGESKSVVLELAGRGTVRGRVVDPSTGDPVPGYLVTAPGSVGVLDVDGTRYTGADGSFELRQVSSGEVELRLWSARARSLGYADFNVTVTVEAGGTTDAGTLDARRTGD